MISRRVASRTARTNETKRFPGWARKLKHPPTSDSQMRDSCDALLTDYENDDDYDNGDEEDDSYDDDDN